MDDASGMCAGECVGERHGPGHCLGEREAFARNQVVDGFAGHEFHDDEVGTGFLAEFIDGDDVGVVQGRCALGFLPATVCFIPLGMIAQPMSRGGP